MSDRPREGENTTGLFSNSVALAAGLAAAYPALARSIASNAAALDHVSMLASRLKLDVEATRAGFCAYVAERPYPASRLVYEFERLLLQENPVASRRISGRL